MKNDLKEDIVFGFAMFAMFFGAGNLIFPPVLGLFRSRLPERLPWRLAAGSAFLVSLLDLLCDTFGVSAFGFVHALPLDSCGLGFVLPSVLCTALGIAVCRVGKKTRNNIKT